MWKFSRSKRRPPADAVPSADRVRPPAPAGSSDGALHGDAADRPRAPRPAPAPGADPVGGIDFAVRSTNGSTRADVAPEQTEDGLPRPVLDDRPLSRADRVGEALDRWSSTVTSSVDGPSFLTQMRAGDHVLDLTHSHPSGLAQLLAGRGATRLSSLVREVGALADARTHARAIRETAERRAEEVGLTTCHLGIGEATWMPADGSEPPHAPVLVRPLTLRLRGNAREDVDLEIDATVDVNPVLLRALREAGVAVDARALLATTDGPYGFDPNPVLDAFRALGEPLPGFRVGHALVVGNLMDTAGPLADDLATDRPDWVASDLVAALAGDEEARAELAVAGRGTSAAIDERELVAAIDPEHEEALARVLDGGHLALTTPPGTDSIDLVVDLLAELNARGKSVLVVSQRRRSLARIAQSVQDRELGDLLFDLSPDPALQRNASEALLMSLRRAGSFRPSSPLEESDALREARSILSGHVEAMHRVQRPWEVSAHAAISALAGLTRLRPSPRTTVRLAADVAAHMIGEDRERFADALREAAASGALSTTAEDTAWFGATITTDTQAARALELVDELREGILPRLVERSRALGEDLGLTPVTCLTAFHDRLALLERVRGVLSVFHASVFTAPLPDLIAATATKQWRVDHHVDMGWGTRRRLVRQAEEMLRSPDSGVDVHAELLDARRVRSAWAAVADPGTTTARAHRVPADLDQATTVARRAQGVCDELAVLLAGTPEGGELASVAFDELAPRLDRLHADADSLETIPRHTTILRRLTFDGLGELVEDLRARHVGEDQVAAELELAWWRSVLELIAGAEPTISRYDGTSLSMVAERFRRLDAERISRSSDRVRAASDDVLVATMKRFPDTSRAAIAELSRSSTTSVRDLAAKYEDILYRARPTWLASPFLVPQILPRGRHFDVVIVADGGRLPTWAALPAIARGAQTVVVGDPLEYAGEDDPTLLDDVLEVAPSFALRRDPQPATGGLRAFAQRRSLTGDVVAVPAPQAGEPDRLVLVDGARGPVMPGAEYVESTEAELRRVTDLVIEHARTRPERSLAVITLTSTHAHAVLDRVMQTVGVVPMLRDFFDPDSPEYFTVVPAEHAASVIRDDVIVSLGFGKTPHGRLIHRFGPLSGASGRKVIVSALTRSRGRTTVVSGLRTEDLDPGRLRAQGARDLHDLLTYLYTGEDPLEQAADAADDSSPEPDDAGPAVDVAGGDTGQTAVVDADDGTEHEASGQEPDETATDHADAAAGLEGPATDEADAASSSAATGEDADAPTVADEPDADEHDTAETRDEPAGAAATPTAAAERDDAETEDENSASRDEDIPAPQHSDIPGPQHSDIPAPQHNDIPAPQHNDAPAPQHNADAAGALVADLADRLWRRGLVVEADYGLTEDRIELALGHPDLPGRYLVAVDTDEERYVATASQRERDRLRAERLEAAGWATERVWSWALFIDPEGEAERILRSVERALMAITQEGPAAAVAPGIGTPRHRLPHPQIPAGQPHAFYAAEDFDAVVEYICSDGRARLEDQLAAEVRAFLGFEKRSVLLDVSIASAIRRYQERL